MASAAGEAPGAVQSPPRTSEEAYNELVSTLAVPKQLERVSAVIHWDSMVTMPQNDVNHQQRALQSAALAGVIHEKTTDPQIGGLIAEVDAGPEALGEWSAANFRLMKKQYVEGSRVPEALEKRKAQLGNEAYMKWAKAREASDFSIFEDTLSECFETAKEVAQCKMGDAEMPVYTKLLDDFETGMAESRINELFSTVQTALVPLIAKVLASKAQPDTSALHGTFPLDKQEELNKAVVQALGFEGRQDVSVHPFTISFSSADVRITSRFRQDEWYQGLAGTVHETGHAIYESNLNADAASINSALSMGVHESQSLFWERHVGLSQPFWKCWGAKVRELMGVSASDEEIYRAVNHVNQGFIRVEADELTYPLHVILRTTLERDIVNGKMSVAELPQAWNALMKELLDVDVERDAQGCLQDVHWSGLAIGYFPTYLLGAICAAQLEHYIRKDLPEFDALVQGGEYAAIKGWLNEKIHKHGSFYGSMDELLERELGEKLNPQYYIDYLVNKYSDIYELE